MKGERVVLLTGNGTLEHGRFTETAVEPEERGTLLARPDGGVPDRNAVVCRGSRIYLRERKGTDWSVFDLSTQYRGNPPLVRIAVGGVLLGDPSADEVFAHGRERTARPPPTTQTVRLPPPHPQCRQHGLRHPVRLFQ
ncbi:hypothetical protein [Streptomyces sp. NBC_01320]|uniref:hypothetical protein n=1 Tax=Streptomyces sp. NBC_01320 TaxID=2903824 RepID=UPI002E1578A1|nr:hypothetical protein OG395_13425 [Streptomyces sp. NBC_01320]